MIIDLRTCQIGQPLRMRNGLFAEYGGVNDRNGTWPHTVKSLCGSEGIRTDSGKDWPGRDSDLDIVEILPMPSSSTMPDPLIFGASIPGSEPVPGRAPELTDDEARRLLKDGTGMSELRHVRHIYAAGYAAGYRAGREAKS